MKTATLLLLLAFILSACATAVTSTPAAVPTQTTEPTPDMKALGAEIDALLTKNYQEGVFDCSVLVAQYGQLILSQGYGFADRYQKIPITPKTKFPIGSLTKQFTALAALMLQAQGKLNMQDRLCDYLADCPEVFKPITLHHLITHTSGAPNTTKWDKPGDMMLSKYETLLYEPGEDWTYADIGYNLTGKVIETVTGQSYETFVQENIFEPHRIYYHGGQPLGYRGAFWRYPDEQITIIQLCNQEAVMLVPTEEAIAEMLLGAKEQ